MFIRHLMHAFLTFALVLLATAGNAQQVPPPAQLMMWVKAEDLKQDNGSRVGYWPDASGHHNHLLATGDTRPVYKSNGMALGMPAVSFGGDPGAGPQYLTMPMDTEWRGASIFIVGIGVGGAGLFYSNLTTAGGCLRTYGWVQLTMTGCAFQKGFQGFLKKDTVGLAEMVGGFDDMDAMRLSLYANGQFVEEKQDPKSAYGIVFHEGRIGNDKANVNFNGAIAEILIYKGVLTEVDRKAVERYLMVKYGLAQPSAGDPKLPAGYTAPVAPKFPPVKAQPSINGLVVWSRADDLKVADGLPVDQWPNVAGDKQPLMSEEGHQPVYSQDGFHGHPMLHFAGNGKTTNFFRLPLTQQEWPEMTIVVTGRRFEQGMLFTSACEEAGSVNVGNQVGVSRAKLTLKGRDYPMVTAFTMASNNEPAVVAATVSKLPNGGHAATAYANGYVQHQAEDPAYTAPLLVKSPLLGAIGVEKFPYNGDVAEILIYNRALSKAELQQTFAYLSEKYQIAFPSAKDAERQIDARSRWSTVYPVLPHSISWLGNSFNAVKDWVQSGLFNLAVQPDGTVALVSTWDERGKCVGLYKDGKALATSADGATEAIATDGTYYYRSTKTWKKSSTVQVQRLTLDLREAPWPALGKDKWPTWTVDSTDGWEAGDFICNIAVGNGELYVNTYAGTGIKVYDAATGALKRTLPITVPRARTTVDRNGKLWVGSKDGVAQYTPEGTPTGAKIDGVSVGALCIDNAGHLLAADNGQRQQVITYDINGIQPKEIGALGGKGGIYTAPRPGTLSPDRLFDLCGVGVDAAGNIYVNNHRYLRAYAPDGKFHWQLYCNEFVTCGTFDPDTDGNDIYTPNQHYRYQPGQPDSSEWAWVGTTQDGRTPAISKPFNGPLHRINGRLYHFTLDGENLLIRRQQESSEFFVPCGMQQHTWGGWKTAPEGLPKDAKDFLWIDRNADGIPQPEEVTLPPATAEPIHSQWASYVDEKGGIWRPEERYGIRYLPLKEVTKDGTLIYDYADEKMFKRPIEFIEVMRAYYDAANDTMYLAGTTWDDPRDKGRNVPVGGMSGREIIRYDDWMKPNRHIHCRMKLPEEVAIIAIDVSYNGQRLIAGDLETAVLFTYDTDSGKLLGILEPDVDKIGTPGWIDVRSGVRIFKRKNGELLVIEENCYSEQNIVYRVPPAKP